MKLWPFFTYFGGKWRAAPHYPAPAYDTLVESFAGSAGYAVRNAERNVILCEANATIAALWRWLIEVPSDEIRNLPLIGDGDHLDSTKFSSLHPCARALIGFWLNKGMTAPCKTPSKWMRDGVRPDSQWGLVIRERIAMQVEAIRHWAVVDDYREVTNGYATWFVDPPYSGVLGLRYRKHDIDYASLAMWCKKRIGQVIVCENAGATWLPFRDFRVIKGMEGAKRSGKSVEVIWTNDVCTNELSA